MCIVFNKERAPLLVLKYIAEMWSYDIMYVVYFFVDTTNDSHYVYIIR